MKKKAISLKKVAGDITEHKEAQEMMRESSDFSQSLIRTLPFGMNIVDTDGNILYLGEKLEAVVGKKCWQVYKDNKKQCENCPLKNDIKIGETKGIEVEGVCGGKTFHILHTRMVYKGKKAILEIFQDITERKKAEEKVRKRAKELERFHKVALGRELKMIELKKRIKELEAKLVRRDEEPKKD